MTDSQLKIIAEMTVELVRLRQNKCEHLSVENIAPEIFANMIMAFEYGWETGHKRFIRAGAMK